MNKFSLYQGRMEPEDISKALNLLQRLEAQVKSVDGILFLSYQHTPESERKGVAVGEFAFGYPEDLVEFHLQALEGILSNLHELLMGMVLPARERRLQLIMQKHAALALVRNL